MEYTIRKPKATDLFVVSKIMKGIGLKNISSAFSNEEVSLIKNSIKDGKVSDEMLSKVGLLITISIGDLILERLEFVENDVFKFIANLTGMKVKDVEDLPLTDFAEILMAIIKEPDFVDFIKVVLKSFK